jgi:hypothetical protein
MPRCHFSLAQPHRQLRVRASSRVRCSRASTRWSRGLAALGRAGRRLRYVAGAPFEPAVEFAQPSPYVPRLPALRAYGAACFRPAGRWPRRRIALMQRMHADFATQPQHRGRHPAGQVRAAARRLPGLRPPDDRRAAHAGPAGALRQRLPAHARRPTAAPRWWAPTPRTPGCRCGARARPGVPADGWLDLDPTNDLRARTGHVRVAVGRDFGDVTPLRGVIRGGGRHTLRWACTRACGIRPQASCLDPREEEDRQETRHEVTPSTRCTRATAACAPLPHLRALAAAPAAAT